MVIRTRRTRKGGVGFTLLEMLLVMALLIALLGAVIFNFSSLQRGADLEEGARQLEALVRFAQAHAANSGRTVQFRFGEEAGSTNSVDMSDDFQEFGPTLRVVWEPDPILQPGVFVDLREATPFMEAIQERVRIEHVRMAQQPINVGTNDLAVVESAPVTALPAMTFFPDGSGETADIVLAAKEREDLRQMTVHVDGITGAVRSEFSVLEELIPVEWMEDQKNSGERPASVSTGTIEPSVQPVDLPETATKDPTQTTNLFDADFSE